MLLVFEEVNIVSFRGMTSLLFVFTLFIPLLLFFEIILFTCNIMPKEFKLYIMAPTSHEHEEWKNEEKIMQY